MTSPLQGVSPGASAIERGVMPLMTTPRSLLLIECGSTWTRAWLIGLAEGHHRLYARVETPTTLGSPYGDLAVGATQALLNLEKVSGRRLYAQGAVLAPENGAGDGVDSVALVISAGGPLRVFVGGDGLQQWAESVSRSLSTADVLVRPIPGSPQNVASVLVCEDDAWPFPSLPPHISLLLGDGLVPGDSATGERGTAALGDIARSLVAMLPAPHHFVVLGSAEDYQRVQYASMGQEVIGLPPQQAMNPGPLNSLLERTYEERVLTAIPGYQQMRRWATTPPLSKVGAFGRVVRFMAQRYNTNILGVDVGATSTQLVGATAQGSLTASASPLCGVRQGAGSIARRATWTRLGQWLTEDISEAELHEAILTRMSHPMHLASTPAELEIDYALAREAIRLLLARQARPDGISAMEQIDVILGTGGLLANVPRPGQAALILLDAIQPRGATSLVLDVAQLAIPLGAASLINPTAAADVVEQDALLMQLGTCFSIVGTADPGAPAVQATLEYADGHTFVVEVLPGTIELLPLAVGQQALLTLAPSRNVDVGLGPGERARLTEPIEGGRLGVLIDARGRPFAPPADPEQRRARLRQWRAAVGG